MSNWATIIYGRTYEVDFRLLVKPEDFQTKDEEWAKQYILVTTRWAERLPNSPRWSLFKNESYCIFGVTCMVNEIASDMFEDMTGRSLFVFIGYVSKSSHPNIPFANLDLVKDSYQKYVRPRWLERDYQKIEMDQKSISKYEKIINCLEPNLSTLEQLISLNTNHHHVSLWPDLEENNRKLWLSACQYIQPISLCLSLARQKDALRDSPFLNGTTIDITQPITLKKDIDKNKLRTQSTFYSQKSQILDEIQDFRNSDRKQHNKAKETLHSSDHPINQIVTEITSISTTFSGIIKLIGNLTGIRGPQNNKQQQQAQSENLEEPKLNSDPSAKQREIYSLFFKPEDQQNQNNSQKDKL